MADADGVAGARRSPLGPDGHRTRSVGALRCEMARDAWVGAIVKVRGVGDIFMKKMTMDFRPAPLRFPPCTLGGLARVWRAVAHERVRRRRDRSAIAVWAHRLLIFCGGGLSAMASIAAMQTTATPPAT